MASPNAGPITGRERIRCIQGGWSVWLDRTQFAAFLAATPVDLPARPYAPPTPLLGDEVVEAFQDGARITMSAADISAFLAGSGAAPAGPGVPVSPITGRERVVCRQSGVRIALDSAEASGLVGGLAPATLLANRRDDFTASAGGLNGRNVLGNTYVAALDNTTGGNVAYVTSALSVTITGKGTLNSSGTPAAKTHGYRVPTPGNGNYDYAVMQMAKAASGQDTVLEFHTTVNPAAQLATDGLAVPYGGITLTQGTSGGTGSILAAFSTAGTQIATGNFATDFWQVGDIVEPRTVNISGTDYLELYVNSVRRVPLSGSWGSYTVGDRISLTALAASGFAITGKHGLRGTFASGATIDSFEGGDMATHGRIWLGLSGRVFHVGTDGQANIRIPFGYNLRDPASLKFNVRLASDNSLVTSAAVASFTLDSVAKTGIATLPPFTPTVGLRYYFELYEDTYVVGDDGQPAQRMGVSPAMLAGFVVLNVGQSNMAISDDGAGLSGATQPANLWRLNHTTALSAIARTNLPINTSNPAATKAADTPNGYFAAACGAAIGAPIGFITGAIGSKSVAERGPGGSTGQYEANLAAIRASGGRIGAIRDSSGESEAGNASGTAAAAAYKAAWATMYAAIKAENGGVDVPVLMECMGTYPSAGDVQNEAIRRAQGLELPAAYPGVFVPAAFSLDLQHDANALVLHFLTPAYGERSRRSGMKEAAIRAPGTYSDRLGPSFVSATKVSDTLIRVRFALGAFTGMLPLNTTYTIGKTDVFGCGVRFGTTTGTPTGATSATVLDGATRRYPTAVSVGAPSGGFVDVDFTFAAGAWTGISAYVSGPYGGQGFNPDKTTDIEQSLATKASMLVGTIASELNVAIQPYWNANGNDFLVAA